MAEVIAILAFCVSVLALFVHWRNQVERRHADITKLRSDFLMKVSAVHHRMLSVGMHLETARLELRKTRNSDDKYKSIERMPRLIEKHKQLLQKLSELKDKLEQLDTMKKATKGDALMRFQSAEHDFRLLEQHADKTEQDALETLTFIRSQQEEANHPEHLK